MFDLSEIMRRGRDLVPPFCTCHGLGRDSEFFLGTLLTIEGQDVANQCIMRFGLLKK